MKKTKILMDMPVTIEIADLSDAAIFDEIFNYFKYIDKKFSIFKKNSEISKINNRRITINQCSNDMKIIFKLAEKTKKETSGYFDIYHEGKYDPSGIVKGWAIFNAAKILKKKGFKNFYVDAGGDVQAEGKIWRIGIKNPFNQSEIIKVVKIKNQGIATSGNYLRGDHIYNPKNNKKIKGIVSLTVIGPNVYEADRFATAVFAMGKEGIYFLERQKNLEGYMIDKEGIATFTSGFEKYEAN